MNDFLMEIFQAGQITLEELLQNGSFPFADKLLQSIRSRQKEGEQGKPMGRIVPPEIQNQLEHDANIFYIPAVVSNRR